jgi:peptidoglycan/xylan/chitin deacetylase (PgdA/CDA1 family)
VKRVPGDTGIKRVARRTLRIRTVAAAFRRLAALRRRSLVLVYHRVAPREPGEPTVVPTVPPDAFRRQVEVLGDLGRIVRLTELLEDGDGAPTPRFALTFDDDYRSHVEYVLPTLRHLNLSATFFLSGRALHGAGPYWFESLERLIAVRGLAQVAALLEMPGAATETLVLACENDPPLQRVIEREASDRGDGLTRQHIEALVDAGMTIGFHTLNHPVLINLADTDLRSALVWGRDELAEIVGHPLLLFAYPHGKGDRRTASKVREAGYVAAWTGQARPMSPRDDQHLLGRWEPGRLDIDEFPVSVTIRLNRVGPAR